MRIHLPDGLESELSRLRHENDILKQKLIEKSGYATDKDESLVLSPNDLTPWNLSRRVQEKISEKGFLRRVFQNFNVKLEAEKPEGSDWWMLVNVSKPEEEKQEILEFFEDKNNCLDGPYVLLNDCDVVEAIAVFILRSTRTTPGIADLPDETLRKRLDRSFDEFHEKGLIRKTWDWSCFLYRAGSWTATAFEIYTDPILAQLLATSVVSSATWLGLGSNLTVLAASALILIGEKISGTRIEDLVKLFDSFSS